MSNKTLYALSVLVSVGILSYLLRALPFLLFGSRKEPPAAVKYIGRILSPAAIAMLVVYCYAGELEKGFSSICASASPFIAGGATIALQLWKRNPLLSILAGTALYMALLQIT